MENETIKEKKTKGNEQLWNIPKLGVSVMASSLEEAIKKATKSHTKI